MRRARLSDLDLAEGTDQLFARVLIGSRLSTGGVSFHRPGMVTHDADRPHTHAGQELFCLLQGEGWLEVDGVREPVRAGDVILIEAGEDHHLISSEHNPLINLWLHADDVGNSVQFPELR